MLKGRERCVCVYKIKKKYGRENNMDLETSKPDLG